MRDDYKRFVDTQLWWVGFHAAPEENRRWWERVMSPKGYHHISMLGLVNGEFLALEWQIDGMWATPLQEHQFDCGLAFMMTDALLTLKMQPQRRPCRIRTRFSFTHCVPVAEQILRLPKTCYTPERLAKYMQQLGAEVVARKE